MSNMSQTPSRKVSCKAAYLRLFPCCFAGSVAADEVVLMYLTAQPSSSDAATYDLPRRSLR